ncbi:VacJ family lipoprotein [Serratia symbiotica str. 'Cinara cedri']|nr:VacJ family lipoprotein [Serratia symbiotica str. 'Cinara cedri']
MNFRWTSLGLITVLLLGCANAPYNASSIESDPLEKFNRKIFDFNYNVLDPYIMRPVAIAWRNYVPIIARNGLNNFTSNLEEPASMVNALLKGDPYHGMIHFNRFFLNSLLGMGGLIDVARMANPALAREISNRFGSTLGYYKVSYGPYIILPGYGSFTFREDGGNWLDTLYPMLKYLTLWMLIGKWVVEGIETRAQFLDSDSLLSNSSCPYIMVREAYFQYHDFIANGGSLKLEENINAKTIQDDLDEIDSMH